MDNYVNQNGMQLQLLDNEWAFDLFKHEVFNTESGQWNARYELAPWNCSWWHKCPGANQYYRNDYIRNLYKYSSQRYFPYKYVGCQWCNKGMPKKFEMMFRAVFANARINAGRARWQAS